MVRRLLWVALSLGAIYFSLQAGEFSTRDIVRQRARRAGRQAQVDALQHTVDSLKRVERMVRSDPAAQERIAREEFGMVRGENEILYRFVNPASSNTASDTAAAR